MWDRVWCLFIGLATGLGISATAFVATQRNDYLAGYTAAERAGESARGELKRELWRLERTLRLARPANGPVIDQPPLGHK